jgi:CRISPR-associated protein Csm2
MEENMGSVSDSDLQQIIEHDDGARLLVKHAEEIGANLKNLNLSTGQIRALFGEVRQIEAQWGMGDSSRAKAFRRLILLKPKMAYRARKERGRAVQELVDVLDPAVELVIKAPSADAQNANFHRFVDFFEAILAYHKAYGGN